MSQPGLDRDDGAPTGTLSLDGTTLHQVGDQVGDTGTDRVGASPVGVQFVFAHRRASDLPPRRSSRTSTLPGFPGVREGPRRESGRVDSE